ncbi:hypothetical protein BH11MYX1_BH11MYX1_31950 [soil metagenome]
MSLRRLISILGVTVVATGSLVVAAPAAKKKPATPAKPVAPAKNPTPAGGAAAAGSGSASAGGEAAGSAVQPVEETPPSDMNGTSENPDNPHAATIEEAPAATVPTVKKRSGYPIQEVLRPITLPRNTSEISIAPHFQASPFFANDAVHARYGITSKVQIGITYAYFGAYNRNVVDPAASSKIGVHSGKAFGLDVTVLLQDWIAVRVGVPFYVNPTAFGLQLGAPIKFTFGDKFAVGGLDDLLTLRLNKFAPSFYQEVYNAHAAQHETTNTQQSNGHLRFSFYGEYQQSEKLAFIGRIGIDSDLGATSGGGGAGTNSAAGTATFIRAGLQYSPRHWFDIGGSVGWDDLTTLGTFGPQLFLALRI